MLEEESSRAERPAGVALISIVCMLMAFSASYLAALTTLGRIPLATGAFLVGGEMETLGPLVYVMVAVVYVLAGLGLWSGKNWARHLAIGVAAIGVVQGTPAISSAVADGRMLAIAREGVLIIVRVMVIWYLMQQPVRDTFD